MFYSRFALTGIGCAVIHTILYPNICEISPTKIFFGIICSYIIALFWTLKTKSDINYSNSLKGNCEECDHTPAFPLKAPKKHSLKDNDPTCLKP
jgi:hypothetical protein